MGGKAPLWAQYPSCEGGRGGVGGYLYLPQKLITKNGKIITISRSGFA